MMAERGVSVDHFTIYRWVQEYAPEMEKRMRWQWRRPMSDSWRVDETYIKVRGSSARRFVPVKIGKNRLRSILIRPVSTLRRSAS